MSAVQKQLGRRPLENRTFRELSFSHKGLYTSLAASYIFHLIFIVALLYSYTQSPKFVAPHVVKPGHDVQGASHLYWFLGKHGNGAESNSRTRKSGISNHSVPKRKDNVFRFTRNLPRKSSNKKVMASSAGPPGNTSNGDDIRPAIPIATSDPVITPADLHGAKGDVIIEITIDSTGNMVATKLEHGLGQAIDQKVLAAVQGWRFLPAIKDSRPISSKQDIHYHFPINDVDSTKSRGALISGAVTQSPCPVLLVGGAADQSRISITFVNMGKLAIRKLEFSCGPSNSAIGNLADLSPCTENNALFYPGQEYTLEYANQHRSRHIQISVKAVMLSDGYIWKPSGGQSCRVVTIDVDH